MAIPRVCAWKTALSPMRMGPCDFHTQGPMRNEKPAAESQEGKGWGPTLKAEWEAHYASERIG